jgi:hypothetical protein
MAVVLLAAFGLSSCEFPTGPTEVAPQSTATVTSEIPDDFAPAPEGGPIYVESNIPNQFPGCQGEGLNLVASFEIEPEGISHVVIRYRLNGGTPETTSAWQESVMQAEGILDAMDHFRFEYPQLGADAFDLFGDQAGVFEYMFLATDNDTNQSKWPQGEGTVAEMPIDPCPDQEEAYSVHDYGVSSTTAGYGPGCTPTEVTFDVIVSGYGHVQDAWLRYEYLAPTNNPVAVSQSFEIPLQDMGEGQGYPGSTRLATTVNVGGEANTYMGGQDGYISYNMYVRLDDQMVFEYPQGGPPLVTINSCIQPTDTPIILIIVPTATPERVR